MYELQRRKAKASSIHADRLGPLHHVHNVSGTDSHSSRRTANGAMRPILGGTRGRERSQYQDGLLDGPV